MAVQQVVLLLALASLFAAAAAAEYDTSAMFWKWLDRQTSPKVQIAASIQEEEVKTATACLQEVGHRNCGCLHPKLVGQTEICTRAYTEARVDCCKSAGDESKVDVGDLFAMSPSVGVCTYHNNYFETAIEFEGTDTTKIGYFTATCELHEDSSDCGGPLCEGLSLSVKGDILRYPKVAFEHGLVAFANADGTCNLKTALRSSHPHAGSAMLEEQSAHLQRSRRQYREQDSGRFLVGQGDIYSGTFWVTSRLHQLEYKTGQFQRVIASADDQEAYERYGYPPEKCFIAKDSAIALEFYKGPVPY